MLSPIINHFFTIYKYPITVIPIYIESYFPVFFRTKYTLIACCKVV